MNTHMRWTLILSLLWAMSTVADDVVVPSRDAVTSGPDHNASPVYVVVTFADERENRVALADGANAYRTRGEYGQSAWSQRVVTRIGRRYRLRAINQWTLSSLGLHCVVYEIPMGAHVNALMEKIRASEQVDSVQALKTFKVNETLPTP